MSKGFNPYTIAITSTKKAIKDRKDKLAEQESIEAMALDPEKRGQILFDIGRAEAECEYYQGAKKKAAEKRLSKLMGTYKNLDSAYSPKSTNLMFKRENEIIELEKVLRELMKHSKQYDERVSFLRAG